MRDITQSGNEYLDKMAQHELLSQEQERELALTIKAAHTSPRATRAADRAVERLVEANVRLVMSIADDYTGSGVEYEDLVQAGCIGLLRAARFFDPDKGRFSTYAYRTVKGAVLDEIQNSSRSIRLPKKPHEAVARLQNKKDGRLSALQREATQHELAEAMEMKLDEVGDLLTSNFQVLSLDMEDDNGTPYSERIPAATGIDEKGYEIIELADHFNNLLSYLEPDEQQVLQYRFGTVDGTQRSWIQVAEVMCLTRYKAEKLGEGALDKLTHAVVGSKVSALPRNIAA